MMGSKPFLFTFLILFSVGIIFNIIPEVYAQETIVVNQTTPCFLNYTASYKIIENCGANEDFLDWILLGWEYISGGYFSVIFISVIVIAVYMKYRTVIYPIFIGIMFLPISYFAFPEVFLSWAVVMAFIGVGILIWYAIIKQTKDY